MLSAQTTDKKVNQVTPALFKKADTPEAMSKLDVKTIQNLIKEIGLAPTKAKNLKRMAVQLIEGNGVRADWDYLENLAGVGHKNSKCCNVPMVCYTCFPSGYPYSPTSLEMGVIKSKKC